MGLNTSANRQEFRRHLLEIVSRFIHAEKSDSAYNPQTIADICIVELMFASVGIAFNENMKSEELHNLVDTGYVMQNVQGSKKKAAFDLAHRFSVA